MGPATDLSFPHALNLIKAGKRVARAGWNGKGMFLFLILDWTYQDESGNYPTKAFVAMKTADDRVIPWLASQSDMLMADWVEVTA